MDILTLAGMVIAIVAIFFGQALDGGKISHLVNVSAFIVVMGGTCGAVILQTSKIAFFRAMSIIKWIVFPPALHVLEAINYIVELSHLTRREGILVIESRIKAVSDPFLQKALELILDGNSSAEVRTTLMVDLESEEQRDLEACRVYESLGGYSPTIGILGTVIGLIHVMDKLTDPGQLGEGVAVAFVATIYGVGFANLLFLPVAHKLKNLILARTRIRELYVEGFASVAEGEHPRMIETRLRGFANA